MSKHQIREEDELNILARRIFLNLKQTGRVPKMPQLYLETMARQANEALEAIHTFHDSAAEKLAAWREERDNERRMFLI